MGLRASPLGVARRGWPFTVMVTSATLLVALMRLEIVTGPAGTLELACG